MNSLLAIFAHPDDESYRPGGLLALLARSGVKVHVLTATRGQAGSCGAPPICTQAELPALRDRELHCACSVLGVEEPILLNYQDGTLSNANIDGIVVQILDIVNKVHPQVILSFGPDGLSGHSDHIVIGKCAYRVFQRVGKIDSIYTMAVPQSLARALEMSQIHALPNEQISLTVDVSEVWDTKLKAIHCHKTQLSSSPITAAPIERQRLFLGTEHFVRAQSRSNEDFFLGLDIKNDLNSR